jgi:hypothetical protein
MPHSDLTRMVSRIKVSSQHVSFHDFDKYSGPGGTSSSVANDLTDASGGDALPSASATLLKKFTTSLQSIFLQRSALSFI